MSENQVRESSENTRSNATFGLPHEGSEFSFREQPPPQNDQSRNQSGNKPAGQDEDENILEEREDEEDEEKLKGFLNLENSNSKVSHFQKSSHSQPFERSQSQYSASI